MASPWWTNTAYPFALDPALTGEFVGREDVLGRLRALWLDTTPPASVWLYGARRMGKTSLLEKLVDLAPEQLACARVSLLRVGPFCNSEAELLGNLAAATAESLALDLGPSAPADNSFQADPWCAWAQALQSISQGLAPRRLVLALDETAYIENLMEEGHLPADFPERFRDSLAARPEIATVLVWHEGPHQVSRASVAFRLAGAWVPVRVEPLTKDEVFRVLQPAGVPWTYTPAALERLYELTGGIPALARVLGGAIDRLLAAEADDQQEQRDIGLLKVVRQVRAVWLRAARAHAKSPLRCVTVADVQSLEPELDQTAHNLFSSLWHDATSHPEQAVLLAALLEGTPLTMERAMALVAPYNQSAGVVLATLETSGLLTSDGACWRYASALFRAWATRRFRPRELHLVIGLPGQAPTADRTIWQGRPYDLPTEVLQAVRAELVGQDYLTEDTDLSAGDLRSGQDHQVATRWRPQPPSENVFLRWCEPQHAGPLS